MNGKAITELIYLLAKPVQTRIDNIRVFVECIGGESFLMLEVKGIRSLDSFQRLSTKPDFAVVQKFCTWDDKFECWKMKPTMADPKVASLVKQDRYNHHNSGPRRLINPNANANPSY